MLARARNEDPHRTVKTLTCAAQLYSARSTLKLCYALAKINGGKRLANLVETFHKLRAVCGGLAVCYLR